MNLFENLKNDLIDCVSANNVSSLVNINDINEWKSRHVFDGANAASRFRGSNRGRKHFVTISRRSTTYRPETQSDALSGGMGGSVPTEWLIGVNANMGSQKSSSESEVVLHKMAQVIIKNIIGKYNFLNPGDFLISECIEDQCNFRLDITFSVVNSWSQNIHL
jgi:hypothetical protein